MQITKIITLKKNSAFFRLYKHNSEKPESSQLFKNSMPNEEILPFNLFQIKEKKLTSSYFPTREKYKYVNLFTDFVSIFNFDPPKKNWGIQMGISYKELKKQGKKIKKK